MPAPTSSSCGRRAEDSSKAPSGARGAPRDAPNASAKPPSATLVFFGAKGGAGTTTVAVNCARGARAADASGRRSSSTSSRDSARSRCSSACARGSRVLDALENLHRLDKDFLHELCAKHKSGLEILAGSEQFERPGAARTPARSKSCSACSAGRTTTSSIDAGNHINSCSIAALYAADTIFVVANPDVPSVRNAQRLVDRVRQLGVGGERIRILLNRASDSIDRAEADRDRPRLRHSPHVPERLQDRVHRAQLRRAAGAGRTTRRSRRSSTASRARSSRPAKSPTRPPARSSRARSLVRLSELATRLPCPPPLTLPRIAPAPTLAAPARVRAAGAARRRAAAAVHPAEGERSPEAAQPAEPRGARARPSGARRERDPHAARSS